MHEDEESRAKKQGFIEQRMLDRPVLEPMSVSDLRLYVAALQEEITRVEAEITRKHGARGHADQFFRFTVP